MLPKQSNGVALGALFDPDPIPIEKEIVQKELPVMEIFGPTIQGEGTLIGMPTYFLRLGGCGHRCTWCDTMFAVDPKQVKANRTMMDGSHIIAELQQLGIKEGDMLTLSGGDPCIHENLRQVIIPLQEMGVMVVVETQGAIWQDWLRDLDMVTLSPKGPSSGMLQKIGDLQMILSNLIDDNTEVTLKVVVDASTPETLKKDLQFANDTFQLAAYAPHVACTIQVCTNIHLPPEEKQQTILRDYRNVISMIFDMRRSGEGEHLYGATAILPQLHTLLWPDIEKGK